MKKCIFLLFILLGCTRKYADYDLINKANFNRESFERPVTLMEVLPEGKDQLKQCFQQWLFFSNAEKEKALAIPSLVRSLCPKNMYLLNAHMTELWWTTIIFTQACVSVETSCADTRRKK
jgi:hypothetical protein